MSGHTCLDCGLIIPSWAKKRCLRCHARWMQSPEYAEERRKEMLANPRRLPLDTVGIRKGQTA